jgi:hypothetical protein
MGLNFSKNKSKTERLGTVIPDINNKFHYLGLKKNEINMLKHHFSNVAGTDLKLSFQEFIALFGYLNPGYRNSLVGIAEKTFLLLDTNSDGLLTYVNYLDFFYSL